MGFYQGLGARLVWASEPVVGTEQARPHREPTTNMVEARWPESLGVDVDGELAARCVSVEAGQLTMARSGTSR